MPDRKEQADINARSENSSRYFQGMATLSVALVILSVGLRTNDQIQATTEKQSDVKIFSDREQSELDFRERTYDKLLAVLLNQKGHKIEIEQRIGVLKLFQHNFHSIFNGRALFDMMEREIDKETRNDPQRRKWLIKKLEGLAKDITRRQEELIGESSLGARMKYGQCSINVFGLDELNQECQPVSVTLFPSEEGKFEREVEARVRYMTELPAKVCSGTGSTEARLKKVKALMAPCLCADWPEEDRLPRKSLPCGNHADLISAEFSLNYYDSPFTDNTLLPGGHRFSLTLKNLNHKQRWATVNHFKFPGDFISAGHRPATMSGIDQLLDGSDK